MAARRRHLYSVEEPREESRDARVPASLDVDRSSSPDVDVPAAVICVFCGDSDCPGCDEAPEERSGIVAIIPWERPGVPMLSRLWLTARATTLDAERFFDGLPDGPLVHALRFAAICELLASTAAFLGFLGIAAVIAPTWLTHLALDPAGRLITLRVIVLGLPAFAGLLVVAHVAHALSIDMGARAQGAETGPRDRARALRFGLYACGWDLVMGPIGAIVIAFKEGWRAAFALSSSLSGLPTRATYAFLHGGYRLDGDRARRAVSTSYVGATIATLLFAVLVLAAITALVLA